MRRLPVAPKDIAGRAAVDGAHSQETRNRANVHPPEFDPNPLESVS